MVAPNVLSISRRQPKSLRGDVRNKVAQTTLHIIRPTLFRQLCGLGQCCSSARIRNGSCGVVSEAGSVLSGVLEVNATIDLRKGDYVESLPRTTFHCQVS